MKNMLFGMHLKYWCLIAMAWFVCGYFIADKVARWQSVIQRKLFGIELNPKSHANTLRFVSIVLLTIYSYYAIKFFFLE